MGVALLAACQPPPEVNLGGTDLPAEGAPTVNIIYPPQSRAGGGGPFELIADAAGDWLLTIALDIDNLELVDPYSDPDPAIVEGQGHWHIDASSAQFGTQVDFTRFIEIPISGADNPAEDLIITVTLRDNDHGQLPSTPGSKVQDTVELKLVTE